MACVMTVQQFIDKLNLALRKPTLYVMGGFGAPLTPANKVRYINKNDYNRARKRMIEKAKSSVFAFDCVNLGKGILWGWCADENKLNGGAVYGANGVADTNADGMYNNHCYNKSADFSKIEVGEFLWMKGHCGYYIGNGLAIECSPKWKNRVQVTAVGNIGKKSGYNTRTWKRHGKLEYLDYTPQGVDVYRLYNPNSGFHYFTIKAKERDILVGEGWRYESVGWKAARSGSAVYCMYNRKNGDHIFTRLPDRRDSLKKDGFEFHGIAFYTGDSGVPVYEICNVHSGEHFYTASEKERDALVKLGWQNNGKAFYGQKG